MGAKYKWKSSQIKNVVYSVTCWPEPAIDSSPKLNTTSVLPHEMNVIIEYIFLNIFFLLYYYNP